MRLPFEFGPDGLPWFYADVPTITLRDGLAATLGAARDGLLTYGYADAPSAWPATPAPPWPAPTS